jgi:hypothetical protein
MTSRRNKAKNKEQDKMTLYVLGAGLVIAVILLSI